MLTLGLCYYSDSVVFLVVFEEEIETGVALSSLLITYVQLLVLLCELKYFLVLKPTRCTNSSDFFLE